MRSMLREINIAASHFLLPQATKETYITIIEEAKKVLNASYGSVILWKNGKLNRVYTSHPELYKIKPRKAGRTYEAFILGEASFYHVKSLGVEPHPILKRLNIKTVVYIPLNYDSETIGVINMLCEETCTFSKERLALVRLFGNLASLAIRRAQLLTETKNSLDNQKLYLSLASHEIKTPLTALYTFVQLLDSEKEQLPPNFRDLVSKVRAETVRINVLVSEFLEGKNIELAPDAYNWRQINFKDVLSRSIENFNVLFPSHDVRVLDTIKKRKILIWGDFDKLLQVVDNILNNAGKYSPPEEKIIVKLQENKKGVIFSVKDSGSGIDPKDIKHIFRKFYRSSNSSQKGMGLGLYLVKNIVLNHGGAIDARSGQGKGSTFIVKLPILKNDKT